MEEIFLDLEVLQQQVVLDLKVIFVELKEEYEIVLVVNFDYES